jgi:hypothetical protein
LVDRRHADVNQTDGEGRTRTNQMLLPRKARIASLASAREYDDLPVTALVPPAVIHHAAIKGDVAMVTLLLSRGANVQTTDVWGFSPAQVRLVLVVAARP